MAGSIALSSPFSMTNTGRMFLCIAAGPQSLTLSTVYAACVGVFFVKYGVQVLYRAAVHVSNY